MKSKKFMLLCAFIGAILVTPKSFSQVLEYATNIKIEKGKKITEKTFLIQINSKESNWLAEVEINHSPHQDFSLLYATIIDASGKSVRKLKKKEIISKNDLSYGAFYQDDLIERFELYWNEYPYQIKYSYRLVEKEFIYLADWYPVVHTNIQTFNSNLRVEIPVDYEVRIDFTPEFQFSESNEDGKRILQWHKAQTKTIQPETFAPPLSEQIPKVTIAPLNFHYGVYGNTASWADFGAWQTALNKGTDQLPDSEKIIIDELIEGITDKKLIVKTLYLKTGACP